MVGGIRLAPLMTELKVELGSFKSEMDKATTVATGKAKEISNNLKNVTKAGDTLKSVGGTLTKFVSVPLAGAAISSVKMSTDFSKSFAKVSTLLDSSTVDFDKYKKNIKQASKEMGVDINEYSEAIYQSISAGVDQSEAITFTSNAVKLAKGGFTETATAVDLMTTIMNSYGDEAGSVDNIMDSLINTQNAGKTTVNELASTYGKLIPVANGAGVEFNVLNGAMATLTAGGISTSESTTLDIDRVA